MPRAAMVDATMPEALGWQARRSDGRRGKTTAQHSDIAIGMNQLVLMISALKLERGGAIRDARVAAGCSTRSSLEALTSTSPEDAEGAVSEGRNSRGSIQLEPLTSRRGAGSAEAGFKGESDVLPRE